MREDSIKEVLNAAQRTGSPNTNRHCSEKDSNPHLKLHQKLKEKNKICQTHYCCTARFKPAVVKRYSRVRLDFICKKMECERSMLTTVQKNSPHEHP